MLMPSHTVSDRGSKPAHLRVGREQLKTLLQFVLVETSLSEAEHFDSIQKQMQQIVLGARLKR
jgi:hypothetical protein